jgi:hypothetical protein
MDDYKERHRRQCLEWAEGDPVHNEIDDECCPDFSCCEPELYEEDAEVRWAVYHRHYGRRH